MRAKAETDVKVSGRGRRAGGPGRRAAEVALCFLLASALVLLPPGAARGDSLSEKQERARQVKQELQANQAELDRLTVMLNQTASQLAALEADISRNQAELEAAQAELERYQGILSRRVKAMYMEGNSSSLEVMLDSASFGDFLNSYDYMRMIGGYDAGMIDATRSAAARIRERRAGLESSRARYEAQAASQASQRAAIQSRLAQQQSILSGLDSEISALVSRQVAAGGGGSGGGSGGGYWTVGPVNGMYFPVAGPHSFTNDWGAPRRVGRVHKGNDIMANYGVPCVAITSGTVTQHSGGNPGNYVFLRADNGDVFWYMHLQSFAASGRVAAGTVIGYVGDTGNARGCPHLHFEYHPGGGAAVNPYPLLRALDG